MANQKIMKTTSNLPSATSAIFSYHEKYEQRLKGIIGLLQIEVGLFGVWKHWWIILRSLSVDSWMQKISQIATQNVKTFCPQTLHQSLKISPVSPTLKPATLGCTFPLSGKLNHFLYMLVQQPAQLVVCSREYISIRASNTANTKRRVISYLLLNILTLTSLRI